ncbi:MAG: hypothetical protein Q9200_004283, partial [Gallowayella weberi]
MTENIPPSTAADSTTRGIPYYEKLKRDLRETIQKKRLLDKNLTTLEDQIYRFESTYLEETSAAAREEVEGQVEAAVDRPHCSVAVIGTRGGVGASTMATSLAWLMSDKQGRSTALLDLDVHFGTGALALDLEPGRGLTDAIENPSRIDGLFIERAMVKASEKLAVLSAEAPINSPLLTDGAAFYQLQEEMRGA